MAINTTSTLPQPVQLWYDNVLLSTDAPNLIHSMGASKKSLKGNSGPTHRMERYLELPTAPVPLGNSGITPPGQNLKSVFIDATISFYGTWLSINEQLPITTQSPVMHQATLKLADSMRRTEDQLMSDMLASTASVIFATGGVNGDTPTEMALSDVQTVVSTLLNNDAVNMSSSLEASNRFGTAPVSAAYFGLGHTKLSTTLSNLSGFTRTHQYGTAAGLKPSEWGASDGVRFFLSSRGSVVENSSGAGEDVYNTFICGMEAYANIKLDNFKAQTIYRDGNYSGPLALNQTVAWKMAEVNVITNDAWIVNLKSTLA